MTRAFWLVCVLISIVGCSQGPTAGKGKPSGTGSKDSVVSKGPESSGPETAVSKANPTDTASKAAPEDTGANAARWDLRLNLKKGAKSRYTTTVSTEMAMSGMGNTNTSNSEFSVLVKDARRDGVTLEYTIKPPSGPMMPGMPKGPTEPIVKTISLDAHGLARGGPESQAAWAQMTMAPLATIQLPAKPVAVGDPWEAKIPSATLFGNRAKSAGANVPTEIVVRYKLISAGKFGGKDSLKVQSTMTMDISGKEAAGESSSPLAGAKSKMDSSTVFWIDPATGQVLDSQTTMKSDTVLPGAAKAGNEGTASTIHMVIKNHTKRVK